MKRRICNFILNMSNFCHWVTQINFNFFKTLFRQEKIEMKLNLHNIRHGNNNAVDPIKTYPNCINRQRISRAPWHSLIQSDIRVHLVIAAAVNKIDELQPILTDTYYATLLGYALWEIDNRAQEGNVVLKTFIAQYLITNVNIKIDFKVKWLANL